MSSVRSISHSVLTLVVLLTVCGFGAVPNVDDVVEAIAVRLEQAQDKMGWNMGSWPEEELFTGSLTAGMVGAYECTGNYVYRTASRRAGYYILRAGNQMGNLLGDEAYALVRLSEISRLMESGLSDVWLFNLSEFYASMRKTGPGYEGTTELYLSYFEGEEPSTTVFLLAHYVVGAYYADDADKELWRDALVRHLSYVDDECSHPVMALGAATWALAQIDGLDDTPLASEGGSTYWEGTVLRDLPALLLSHQVPAGEAYGGSFYWRFDHSEVVPGGIGYGFTEDAIYATLGLVAAASAAGNDDANEAFVLAITAAQEALLRGVDEDGEVYEHLAQVGQKYHAYAGEMLQALWSTKQYLDALADSDSDGTGGGG